MAAAPVQVVDQPEQALAMLDPIRLRLLSNLAEPDSAIGLARRLELPRQRINYHLKELEKAGLIELVEERRKGNCTERLVQATGRAYLIDPAVMGPLEVDPAKIRDRFSASYLIAAAARTIRDLASMGRRADATGTRLDTLTIQVDVRFTTAEDRNAFAEDLTNEVAKLVREYHDDQTSGGRSYRFLIAGYPAPTSRSERTPKEADS